jgi:transcriptional regulator with XRE-family HTH domain
MTRRPDLDAGFDNWLLDLGAHLSAERARRGWTQARAAEACGIDLKQYQDVEYGRRALSTRSLYRMACAFGLSVVDLLAAPDPTPAETARADSTSDGLAAAGWSVVPLSGRRKPPGAVPVLDLRPRAGHAGASQKPEAMAWAVPPSSWRRKTEGVFLAQVWGNSMAPQIASGAWCLFRQPVVPPLLGKTVLCRVPDGGDDSGAWLCKRVGGVTLDTGGLRLRLDSLAADMAPRWVTLQDEADLGALGEWLQVLDARPATPSATA